jgi:hypothetical protein
MSSLAIFKKLFLMAGWRSVSHLFLVGGFAESPLVQEEVRHHFNATLKVVIPQVSSFLCFSSAMSSLSYSWLSRAWVWLSCAVLFSTVWTLLSLR